MPNELDDNIASASSPEVESPSGVEIAESPSAPTATGENESPKSLLDAVNGALEGDSESEPPADEKKDENIVPEQTDENLPFNKHPRFQELIKQKNEFKEEVESLKATVEREYAPKVQQYDAIQNYMQENRLQPQEVQEGFKLMAMLKNDPAQFVKAIAPYLQSAARFTGEVLPSDLQAEVDGGYMTLDRARELASLRVNSQFQNANLQERLAAEKQAREQEALIRTVEANRAAVNNVEAQWKAADPDYERKQPFIMSELKLLAIDTPPRSPAEAVALAEKAKANVEARLRGVMPAKKPVSPTPQGRAAGTTPTKKPTSLRDAVEMAIANTE